jgi:hypothetical protein
VLDALQSFAQDVRKDVLDVVAPSFAQDARKYALDVAHSFAQALYALDARKCALANSD